MMWVDCCRRCKKATISIDHVAKKKRCSACGLECDYDSIKDGDGVAKNDTVRLRDLTNPLIRNNDLSIATTEPKNGSGNSQNRGSDPVSIATTEMNSASSDDDFVSIADMSDRLGLPETVKDMAYNEFFKKVEAFSEGKPRTALLVGCIYIACRVSEMTRSLNEISSVANEATLTEILKAIEFISDKLNMDTVLVMGIEPVDFIKRFCTNLGMDSIEIEAVKTAAEGYKCAGRCPASVAAGFAFAYAKYSRMRKLFKEVEEATGISAKTIAETFDDIYPYLSTEVPIKAALKMKRKRT